MEKVFNALMARVGELQAGTGGDVENMTIEERTAELNLLFTEQVVPLLREINTVSTQA